MALSTLKRCALAMRSVNEPCDASKAPMVVPCCEAFADEVICLMVLL